MGPQASKSCPGHRVVRPAAPAAQRARQEIDYGRCGKGCIFGAFCPATGAAFTAACEGRTTANWVDFLGQVEGWIAPRPSMSMPCWTTSTLTARPTCFCSRSPARRWEFVFQPTYAAYLNLIEPWWKILRSLALKGRRFEAWAEIEQAVRRATESWNAHKHPFVRGRRRRHRTPRRLGIAAAPNVTLI